MLFFLKAIWHNFHVYLTNSDGEKNEVTQNQLVEECQGHKVTIFKEKLRSHKW